MKTRFDHKIGVNYMLKDRLQYRDQEERRSSAPTLTRIHVASEAVKEKKNRRYQISDGNAQMTNHKMNGCSQHWKDPTSRREEQSRRREE